MVFDKLNKNSRGQDMSSFMYSKTLVIILTLAFLAVISYIVYFKIIRNIG
jgi:hypothetical protein